MKQEMIGESAVMQALRRRIAEVAGSDLPCLITGETGSGKELVGWELNKASGREPYIRYSCAGIPGGLLYSALFGHRKGSFTGSVEDRDGIFVEANGGMLLLDEIGDFSVEHQPLLIRTIDHGEVKPLGVSKPVKVDVRLIATTNQDLPELVRQGRFRADLLYLLSGCIVAVPSLRERAEDIPLLARHFVITRTGENKEFDPEAIELLMKYPWPGNVRELKYEIEGAVLRAGKGAITPKHLRSEIISHCEIAAKGMALEGSARRGSADSVLCDHTLRVLADVSGNKSRAAKILGIHRKTLGNRLKRWEQLGLIKEEGKKKS